MPISRSNLLSSNDDIVGDISNLREIALSNEIGPTEKSTAGLNEKNGYHDSVYINAANIFQGIHKEKPQDRILVKYGNDLVPSPHFKDERSQRWSYELAFSSLKYQDILENILIDSCVYPSALLCISYLSFTRIVQNFILYCSFKTKLAAALARCRIKHDALSIECILPEIIQKQEKRASALPLYAWINTLKFRLEDVYSVLKREGFTKVESVTDFEGYTYCLDKHCEDVLVFPSYLKEELLDLELFTDYKLLLQDKSRSLAVHSSKALLNMDDDVLVAHMGSQLTIAHMSILANQGTSKVFVCGVKSQEKEAELKDLFTHIECKNVKTNLIIADFPPLNVDAALLKDFSQESVTQEKLKILVQQQLKELTHAMQFNKAQAIVYCTSSIYPEENETVVNKALESGVQGSKAQPYRLSPPVLPLCCKSEINASVDKFFKMEPSEISNCCFIGLLTRERDPSESMSVSDVLARAAAKGLLEGIDVAKSSKKEKKKKKPKVMPQRSISKDAGMQIKIQEFLSREIKPIQTNSDVPIAKEIISVPQKSVTQTTGSIQLKKTSKPLSNPSLPGMLKDTPNLSSMSKVFQRQKTIRKPRSEDKMVALKPVEIVLPPVMVPYFNPQGNTSRILANHYYYRWLGTKSSTQGLLIPSLSKSLTKSKESLPPTVAKHHGPWH
uniref:NOP2/Sun RNA methyltransferase family member 7 n=1 Tax=Sphenodon punctatus TaxID=8508 RepID=A0A8D0HEF9_SPHPU